MIAQHLLEKLDDNMPNLVQEIPDETFGNLYGIDYSRLTTILWATCRDLIKRIEVLESKKKQLFIYSINHQFLTTFNIKHIINIFGC